jgi:hypothetical protein
VAHAYNPIYSGGRDQEDHRSKSARANSSVRPYLEKTHHKNRASEVAQGEGPEFKPQYLKNKQTKTAAALQNLNEKSYNFIESRETT